MSMSPADSPRGLFPSPGLSVTRINKRAIAIAMIVFGGSGLLLILTIFGRDGSNTGSKDLEAKGGKASLASPPLSLKANPVKLEAGELAKGVTADLPALKENTTNPELSSEEDEYGRELRRLEHQRVLKTLARRDAAFLSSMLVPGSGAEASAPGAVSQETSNAPSSLFSRVSQGDEASRGGGAAQLTAALDPNMQGRKEAFYDHERPSSYLSSRKEPPRSSFEVKQGTVIPAIMITGINSDLPGQIIGQVSQNVFDSVSGRTLLIPQGTKIIGSYDSFVAVGQERAMVAWRRLIFPDGMSLELLNMPGADQGGYSGFSDQVNNHYLKIFGGALMLSLVGAGYQISQPEGGGEYPNRQEIIAAQIGQQLAQVSGELIRRNMQIQPTIEIRPGYRFNVMVNKDMILEPYEEPAQ